MADIYRETLIEALRGDIPARPGPAVGALLVKGRRIVSRGCSLDGGRKNALREMLDRSSPRWARGSDLYLSQFPPIEEGEFIRLIHDLKTRFLIRHLHLGDTQIHPRSFRHRRELKMAGISIVSSFPPEISSQIRELNEHYFTSLRSSLPWVAVKYAMTADGKMATATFNSKWISSRASREKVHHLRSRHDGIWVGEHTVISDNPRLTARVPGQTHRPLRIVVNTRREIPLSYHVFNSSSPTLFILSPGAPRTYQASIERRRHRYLISPMKGKRVDYPRLLERVKKEFNLNSLLVEGGAKTLSSLLEARLIDKLYCFIAPRLLGDGQFGLSPFHGRQKKERIQEGVSLRSCHWEKIGKDMLLLGYLHKKTKR